MTHKILAALMCSTLILTPVSARAAIDAQGAEVVKKMIKDITDRAAADIKSSHPNIEVRFTGDYKVEPKDTYYAVTTPHMVVAPTKDSDIPLVMDYGVTHINVMPGATPTQWRMAAALPSPIRFIGDKQIPCAAGAKKCTPTIKKSEMAVSFKTTKYQILWDDAQKIALKQDALFENFELSIDQKKMPLTLARITFQDMNSEKTPGLFDGQRAVSATGFSMDMTPENCKTCTTSGKISVGEIVGNGSYTGFDLKKYNDFSKKMDELTNAGFDPDKGMSSAAFSALWSEVMKNGMDTMDSGRGDITVRDLSANIVGKDGKSETFEAKNFKYYGGFDAWRSEKANVHFGIDTEGITLPAGPSNDPYLKAVMAYIPTQAHHKFELKNLPHRKMFEQLGTMAQSGINAMESVKCPAGTAPDKCPKPDGMAMQQAQLLGMQAMMTLPQLLAQAGTVATLHLDADAPKGSVLIDGEYTARADAIFSGVSKLKAVLGGIDSLVADLQAVAKDKAVKPNDVEKINRTIGILTTLQAKGQAGKDAKGNDARTYDIMVDEKGSVTLNGAPMMPGAGSAPEAPQLTAPPSGPAGSEGKK